MGLLINIVIILILSFLIYRKVRTRFLGLRTIFSKGYLISLTIIHFSIGLFSWYWSLNNGGDSLAFYCNAKLANNWFELFGLGSTFVSFLIFPLMKIGVNYFTLFIMFSVISFFGFLNYIKDLLLYDIKNKLMLFTLLLFLLPSLHFWTGFLSKDVLMFYLMSCLLIIFRERKYFTFKCLMIYLLIGVIRPHIFIVLILSFIIVLLLEKKIKPVILAVVLLATSYPLVVKFIKIPSYSVNGILSKLKQFNDYGLARGDSHIDLFNTSYLERIWALLFRPFFIDANTIAQWAVSIENLFFLGFIFLILYKGSKLKKIFNLTIDVKFALLSSFLIIMLIGTYIYNLGLASRMRVMIIPYILYAVLKVLGADKEFNKLSSSSKSDE